MKERKNYKKQEKRKERKKKGTKIKNIEGKKERTN